MGLILVVYGGQLSKIEELIADGTKDKDIMKVLGISRDKYFKMKKVLKSTKNANQDIELKNNNTYILPRKNRTNLNHKETNLDIDSSFESLEGVEHCKAYILQVKD